MHPRAEELRNLGVRRELAVLETEHRRRRAQTIDEALQQAVIPQSQELLSVANQLDTLDSRVQDVADRQCTLGGEKKSFTENCGFADVFSSDKPQCMGCSTCIGCVFRPPTCGGLGRGFCSSDRDCIDFRHCDRVACSFGALDGEIGSDKQPGLHSQLCNEGPHYYARTGVPGGGAKIERANTLMLDFETLMFEFGMRCGLTADRLRSTFTAEERMQNCANAQKFCQGGLFTASKPYSHNGSWVGPEGTGNQLFLDPNTLQHLCNTENSLHRAPNAGEILLEACSEVNRSTITAARTWALCTLESTTARSPSCPDDFFFSFVSRDCSAAQVNAQNMPYVMSEGNRGLTLADGSTGSHPMLGRWMSPLRLPLYLQTTEGYACGCMRPRNADGVMGSINEVLENAESCKCGDFADQPTYNEPALNLNKNSLNYLVYNALLCNLYLTPEHMCFPSIPTEIGALGEWSFDVRAWLIAHEVNFYCDGQPHNTLELQECDDEEIRVTLHCLVCGYVPMVFDPTPWFDLPKPFLGILRLSSAPKFPRDITQQSFFSIPWATFARVANAWHSIRVILKWPAHQSPALWITAEIAHSLCLFITFPVDILEYVGIVDRNGYVSEFRNDVCSSLYFPKCEEMEEHFARATTVNTPFDPAVGGLPHVECFDWPYGHDDKNPSENCRQSAFPWENSDMMRRARDANNSYSHAGYTCSQRLVCSSDKTAGRGCPVAVDRYNRTWKRGYSHRADPWFEPLPIPGPASLCFIANFGSLFSVGLVLIFVVGLIGSFYPLIAMLADPFVYLFGWILVPFYTAELVTLYAKTPSVETVRSAFATAKEASGWNYLHSKFSEGVGYIRGARAEGTISVVQPLRALRRTCTPRGVLSLVRSTFLKGSPERKATLDRSDSNDQHIL